MSDIQERLLKYRDALVTGDPDRQLREGADVEIINDAVARIAALERQLARIPKKWRQLYETEKLTRKLADKQLAAARQTLRQTLRQLAEVQELLDQIWKLSDRILRRKQGGYAGDYEDVKAIHCLAKKLEATE